MKKMNLLSRVALLLTVFFTSCETAVKYGEPKQLISLEQANDLHLRYKNERSNILFQALNFEDANAVWFSVEELENYIHYAKEKGNEQNINIDGIRFYLGVYPNDTTTYHDKAGKMTIFLTPTKKRTVDVDKKNAVNKLARQSQPLDPEQDVTSIQPMNFGNMGTPPKMTFGE